MASTELSREELATNADPIDDKRIMLFSLPAEKFLHLCSEFPKMSAFIFDRAMVRRNMFRNIEIVFNNRYGVDRNFDFCKSIAKNKIV